MNLEGRITRLENRLDKMELNYTASINELHKNVNADRDTIQNRFTSLIERMNSLENAVESEHETSLDLLEVLIQKSEAKKSYRAGSSGNNGSKRLNSSSNSR